MSFVVPTHFTAVDRFTQPMLRMTQANRSFAAQAEIASARANRAFASMMSPLRRVGRMLGTFGLFVGGTALVMGISSVIGVFSDFEQANANLASVLGKSKMEIVALNEDAKRLGATTAFTASEVAGLQTEYAKLGFSQKEILDTTAATLALAAATRTELPQASKQVGAAVRAFNLDAAESVRVADVFAASTSKSALNMEFLDVAMSKVAPVAKQFGFSIEESTALLGKLADAGFDASTAATSTRNILLNMADSGGKLAKALGRPVTNIDDMTAGLIELRDKGVDLAKMLDLTDKRSVAAFATFLEGAEGVKTLAAELRLAQGTAQEMATKQLDTLQGSVTKMKSAWEGFILSNEDGQGTMARGLRTIVDTATEMLSLASGTAKANSELTKKEQTIRSYAEIASTTIKLLALLAAGLLAFKIVIIATQIALGAYNIILGITGALSGTASIAIGASTIALKAYRATLFLATAAQWLWNAAMTANPIGLIIVGVAALIALVAVVVQKWNEWGAALALFMGPIGLIVSAVMSFRRNWDMVVRSFSEGGIIEGIKAIGKVLLDAILMPIQQILEITSRLTGFDWAADAANGIKDLRANLDLNTIEAPTNPQRERQDALERTVTQTNNSRLTVDNRSGFPISTDQPNYVEIENSPTFSLDGR